MTKRVVGYFENWAQYRPAGGKFLPAQINPDFFTHINFAFGLFGFVTWSVDPTPTRTGPQRLTGDYTVQPVEFNDQTVLYPALQALKQQNGNLKTLLSIGGWNMNSCGDTPNPGNEHPYGPYTCQLFSQMAADPNGRTQFINSAIAYAQKYRFDGIDIDWEYPGYVGRGGGPNDLANFLALAQQFRAAAPPNFLLTMAASAIVPTGLPQPYQSNPRTFFQWLEQCSQSFDWLNVLSYDYHGAFDDPVKIGTGVNAPLAQDSTPNGPYAVKWTVLAYLAAGIPSDKIVLGMPTYGRGYVVANPGALASNSSYGQPFSGPSPPGPATQVPGILAYYEIIQQIASGALTPQFDTATLTPYAYNSTTGQWVSYDNPQSLAYKTAYVNAIGLGGAMIWSIDDDDFANGYPLVTAITNTLNNPGEGPQLPAGLQPSFPATAGSPQNWMSQLPDTFMLSQLSIPGTHESCAHLPYWDILQDFVNCQDWSLAEQLNHGIRYLDIRCQNVGNFFQICHDVFPMLLEFGVGVRDVCVNFLTANPRECIVMQIREEVPPSGSTLTFQQRFDQYVQGFESSFYLDDHIPTLGEVRGKIVLVRRFDLDPGSSSLGINASAWADDATFPVNYTAVNGEPVGIEVQDQYMVPYSIGGPDFSIGAKWNAFGALLDQAKSDASSTWYINEASGTYVDPSYLGEITPRAIAEGVYLPTGDTVLTVEGMNSRLYDYLAASPFPNRLGTLLMDFPDDNTIGRIIGLNTQAATTPARVVRQQTA